MEPDGAFGHVNDSIRKLATDGPATDTWEFFCECPDVECHVLVPLTLLEFDERRMASPPAPILATHHDHGSAVSAAGRAAVRAPAEPSVAPIRGRERPGEATV